MSTFSIIITAGGLGKRMESSLPKQFIAIKDRPILMYSIEQFYHFDPNFQLILTLPEDWKLHWEELMLEHDFKIPHRVVTGGKERYHSVKNALEYCTGDFIATHDGVRPLVGYNTLKKGVEAIKKNDAVVPVVAIGESMRQKVEGRTKAVNRTQYMLVQTPQWFKKEVIEKAYLQEYHEGITDDAGLIEEAGYIITTVEGNLENIKITHKSDLQYAELFLK